MIGLGSNRLTVCRRGGMSVTQAGRGGMEWLAGGRVPDWITPYSAQATAALLAQFPTQWPTIRDYGFAHPALVPFINEDPMLVMSLIDGLGERWLIGDNLAYINLGVKSTPTTEAHLKVKYTNASARMDMFGARTSASDNATAFYVAYAEDWGSGHQLRYYNGSNTELGITLSKGIHEFTLKPNVFILDGTTYNCGTNTGSTYNLYCMSWNNGGNAVGNRMNGQYMAFLELKNTSGGDLNMVPCKNPNGSDYGMLDTVNARWYANAGSGSFTISEEPAS